MSQKVIKTFLVLIFLTGLAFTLYPLISNALYEQQEASALVSYAEFVEDEDQTQQLAEMRAAAHEYNDTLLSVYPIRFELIGNKSLLLPQIESNGTETFSSSIKEIQGIGTKTIDVLASYPLLLNTDEKGTMATISIPKIGIELPIYHGTSVETLSLGVGHLEGTSLPVGGAGTNCTLTAHTGLLSRKMFTDIDQLELGDTFYLETVEGQREYTVDKIISIDASDLSILDIDPEKEHVTLVTCIPLNMERLVVRGVKSESPTTPATDAAEPSSEIPTILFEDQWFQAYLQALLIGLGILLLALITFLVYRKKRGRR